MRQFAVIGTRRPTLPQRQFLTTMLEHYVKPKHVMHTGAAQGIDQIGAEIALERGATVILHLPWSGYEEKWIDQVFAEYGTRVQPVPLDKNDAQAIVSVTRYHRKPYRISDGACKLHACNYNIVKRVEFVLAAPSPQGDGTQQGIRIAKHLGIPVVYATGSSRERITELFQPGLWGNVW